MSKVDLEVVHVLSVEKDPNKIKCILEAHRSVLHVFDNVDVFEQGSGYCYKCEKTHSLDEIGNIDIFGCGPSCKDMSPRNAKPNRGCYEDQHPFKGLAGRGGLPVNSIYIYMRIAHSIESGLLWFYFLMVSYFLRRSPCI